jgi:3-dehydroquinate synthase
MELGERGYDITVGRGLLSSAGDYFNLNRKVFILTDSGVPAEYSKAVKDASLCAKIATIPMGEESKSAENYISLLREMINFGLTRTDCVVAVGGGVVGDLAGFLAASYMRGIDFYNCPTTLLSQVDSSIGGKVAIDLAGVKNIVGAFHQPRGVLIDIDTLKTLPKRQVAAGLAESVKMSLTSDEKLFSLFESEDINDENIEEIIIASLKIKKQVVEQDEREGGLRRILNFGHTFGHGIEAVEGLSGLYHGECVALGMLPMTSDEVYGRLLPVLKRIGLPYEYRGDVKRALELVSLDKKCDGGRVSAIFVDKVGTYRIEKMAVSEFCDTVISNLGRQA